MADTKPLAEVELSIPSRPEYVGVARLAILGVASRMRFSYDEVEDIRLAVGEACTRAIERMNGSAAQGQPIRLRCVIEAAQLVVEVHNPLGSLPSQAESEEADLTDSGDLGGVLIRILMDEVHSEERTDASTHVVRMVKYTAR